MRRELSLLFILILVLGGFFALRTFKVGAERSRTSHLDRNYRRIISTAPSITETLFAVGAGDRVVGVTRYCAYPAEALKIPKIGGYIDTNYEAITRLKPDLIIVGSENKEIQTQLAQLHQNVLAVDYTSIDGILDTTLKIGGACGKNQNAETIVSDMKTRIARVAAKSKGLTKPRVMICIGRSMGGGLNEVYVAGQHTIYDDMIHIAGGVNAYDGRIIKTPTISAEGIIRINPDVIIELVTSEEKRKSDSSAMASAWSKLSGVNAVGRKRIYTIEGDYVVIPGPRFIRILEEIARSIHPEVDWKKP